jgi:hypothetical protein
MVSRSGVADPDSHWLTVGEVTPTISASSVWVRFFPRSAPSRKRACAMRFPSVSTLVIPGSLPRAKKSCASLLTFCLAGTIMYSQARCKARFEAQFPNASEGMPQANDSKVGPLPWGAYSRIARRLRPQVSPQIVRRVALGERKSKRIDAAIQRFRESLERSAA